MQTPQYLTKDIQMQLTSKPKKEIVIICFSSRSRYELHLKEILRSA